MRLMARPCRKELRDIGLTLDDVRKLVVNPLWNPRTSRVVVRGDREVVKLSSSRKHQHLGTRSTVVTSEHHVGARIGLYRECLASPERKRWEINSTSALRAVGRVAQGFCRLRYRQSKFGDHSQDPRQLPEALSRVRRSLSIRRGSRKSGL
jgi:hypothetical protein